MNAPVYFPINSVQEFPFLHILANIYVKIFLITAILTGVRQYLIGVSKAFFCLDVLQDHYDVSRCVLIVFIDPAGDLLGYLNLWASIFHQSWKI